MTIGERIKMLRKTLSLTQAAFGEPIGMKQSIVGLMESGHRSVTDKTILIICEKYNVNESWLRTGKGEMFAETKDDFISSLVERYQFDDLDRMIIEAYMQLNAPQRKVMKAYLRNLINKAAESKKSEPTSAATDIDIDSEVEDYRHELETQKKAADASSVSDGPDENEEDNEDAI